MLGGGRVGKSGAKVGLPKGLEHLSGYGSGVWGQWGESGLWVTGIKTRNLRPHVNLKVLKVRTYTVFPSLTEAQRGSQPCCNPGLSRTSHCHGHGEQTTILIPGFPGLSTFPVGSQMVGSCRGHRRGANLFGLESVKYVERIPFDSRCPVLAKMILTVSRKLSRYFPGVIRRRLTI